MSNKEIAANTPSLQSCEGKTTLQNASRWLVSALLIVFLSLTFFFTFPGVACANDGNTINFAEAAEKVADFVTIFLLPVAIVSVAWRLLYVAIVGGIIGADPLNIIPGSYDGVSPQEVKIYFFLSLAGFLRGLCWVGGFWLILEIAIRVVGVLAATIQDGFS